MEHGNALGWLGRVACVVQPRISRVRFGMTFQVKHFHNSIPSRFTVETFFDGDNSRGALLSRHGAYESRPSVRRYGSCRSLYEIADAPKAIAGQIPHGGI